MNIIFLIDTSGSMKGEKIESVKDSIDNLLFVPDESDRENIKIAVQFFSRDIRWAYDELTVAEQYRGINPTCSGMTSMGAAFDSLAEFLTKNQNSDDYKILLITDGAPTDDYEKGLLKLYQAGKFHEAEKFALAVGDNVDFKVLEEFTGSHDRIYRVGDLDFLAERMMNRHWGNPAPARTNINSAAGEDDDIWS